MPECSICRRSYDGAFTVFVPPHPEAFDTIECARRAARAWGTAEVAATPIILPTIQTLRLPAALDSVSSAPRRRIAALTALALAPGQAALAGGVGLLAGGTAASAYLAARPSHEPARSVVAAQSTHRVTSPRPSVSAPPAAPSEPYGASPATRPPDATARTLAPPVRHTPRQTRGTARTNVDRGVALNAATAEASGSAQLTSRPVSVAPAKKTPRSKPVSTAKPKPEPKPKPRPEPTATPKPKPRPTTPTPTPEPTTPTNTEPPAAQTGASPVAAAAVASTVTATATADGDSSTSSSDSATAPPTEQPSASPRPGNGYGDRNHEHTGPPGHDDRDHGNDRRGHGH